VLTPPHLVTVLFVDDEPAVLEGLENGLRSWRWRRTLLFAYGAREALRILAQQPVDVIACDMHMPGMDGEQLLTHVRQQYPHIGRIILCGHIKEHDGHLAVPVAHKILAKPCHPMVLDEIIEELAQQRRV
jgi:CheY-like chemotaxis protein